MAIPDHVRTRLAAYPRTDPGCVLLVLGRLGVAPSWDFVTFYEQFAGPFWGGRVGLELLDLCDHSERAIPAATRACREVHGFPGRFLWLTDMCANAGLALDTETDEVYEVDFEGGSALLMTAGLPPRWPTFAAFLDEYFGDTTNEPGG